MNTEMIFKSVGGFGRFQKLQCFFFSILWITCGFQTLLQVFIFHLPSFRCRIPGWQNDTFLIQNETHFSCIKETIPFEENSNTIYSQCYVYNRNDSCGESFYSEIPLGNTSDVKSCTSWVYDDSIVHDTAATQMNLVCDKLFLISTASIVYISGQFVGSILFGSFSDSYGRKPIIVSCILINIVANLPLPLVNNAILLNVCRFFAGAATQGLFMVSFILAMEMVTCSWRSTVGLLSQIMYVLGEVLLVVVSYFVNGWHYQCLVIAGLLLPTIGLCFGINESPRWLISNGKLKQAEQIFGKISRMNGTTFSGMKQEKKTSNVKNTDETEPEVTYMNEALPLITDIDKTNPKVTAIKKITLNTWSIRLLKSKVLFLRFFISSFIWGIVSAVYFGSILNDKILSVNIYTNALIRQGVEVAAYIFLILTIDNCGRKPLLFAWLLISGCVGGISNMWFGRFAISSAFGILFITTAEIFPTVVRNYCFALSSSVGKIYLLITPYIVQAESRLFNIEMDSIFRTIYFGFFAILAGVMLWGLPETKRQKLPETIEDGENLGRKKNASIQEKTRN